MTKEELNYKLAFACKNTPNDLDKIKNLLVAGADPNQLDKYGASIFASVFMNALYYARDDAGRLPGLIEKVKDTIQTMVAVGWDVKRFGLPLMHQFIFSTYDRFSFELFKFMLQYDLGNRQKSFDSLLEAVGSEESFQRCCEEDHELENLFYAIYELMLAKKENRSYEGIDLYYGAIGRTVDKIICFNDADTTVFKNGFTEFDADIGFVCGEKLLALRKGINILLMNDRINETPQIDCSDRFGNGVIGSRIQKISFGHKTIIEGNTHYGQPTIILTFESGKKIKFSHNFGELPDKQAQCRFWTE